MKAQLWAEPGIAVVASAISERIPEQLTSPKKNRRLFVEPRLMAQQLGVPVSTVEKACHQLFKLGVLRLWIRAKCPNPDESDEGVVCETDDIATLEASVDDSCEYCGAIHTLSELDREIVFAINHKGTAGQDVDAIQSITKSQMRRIDAACKKGEISGDLRCELLSEQAHPGVAAIRSVLALNSDTVVRTTPFDLWVRTAGVAVLALACVSVLPCVAYWLLGDVGGIAALVCTVAVAFVVVWGWVKSKLAPQATQLKVLTVSGGLSLCLMGHGMGVKYETELKQGSPWYHRLTIGDSSHIEMTLGVVLFFGGLICVCVLDRNRCFLKT
jgi:hypothetical protein